MFLAVSMNVSPLVRLLPEEEKSIVSAESRLAARAKLVRVRVGLHGHNEPSAARQEAPVAQPVELGANPLRVPHRVRARSTAIVPGGVCLELHRLELHDWGLGARRLP